MESADDRVWSRETCIDVDDDPIDCLNNGDGDDVILLLELDVEHLLDEFCPKHSAPP